jgi:hypothetical protein
MNMGDAGMAEWPNAPDSRPGRHLVPVGATQVRNAPSF